jgi:hypothetical protein
VVGHDRAGTSPFRAAVAEYRAQLERRRELGPAAVPAPHPPAELTEALFYRWFLDRGITPGQLNREDPVRLFTILDLTEAPRDE